MCDVRVRKVLWGRSAQAVLARGREDGHSDFLYLFNVLIQTL